VFRGFVSSYSVQNTHFVDSFHPSVFKRFVSWVRFVRKKSLKGSFHINSEGFVNESRILSVKPFLIVKYL
jgi:hypothetical protein